MAGVRDPLRHGAFAAAIVLAVAALAGCGSGGGTTIINQTTGAANKPLSATTVARGPSDLAENITGLLGNSFKQLEGIHVDCPDEPSPPDYPVSCTMTAIDTSKPSNRDDPDGKHRPVSGTISVRGVYPRTRTYAFTYDFSASSGRK